MLSLAGPFVEDVSWLDRPPFFGFVIYRCDYRKEWDAFISTWTLGEEMYRVQQYGAAGIDIAGKLLFTVHDDRTALEDASAE
jgi:hypothetical protein